jgi:hypothetical protein
MKRPVSVALRLAALAPLVAIGVAVVVRAATPVADNVIHACYHAITGQLRVVPAGRACLPSELPLAWNQIGPPGPQGDAGPAGPTGPTGTFSGVFQSGDYGLTVSDGGIALGGPGGQVVIDETGVQISSDGGVGDPTGATGDGGAIAVRGQGVAVSGPIILLNTIPDAGAAAARAGDPVDGGTITGGSSSVFIGP